MQAHEHDPPEYYTPAGFASVARESMAYVGLLVGSVFGVTLRKGYGYPAAEIHARFDELGKGEDDEDDEDEGALLD